MLKNLKVGTKLVAILVAPVVVLLLLAIIGVRQRLDVAQAADRVQQLTQFAQADYKLATEFEKEGIYSAQYMATRKAAGKAELEAQRAKTDEAKRAFDDAAKNLDASATLLPKVKQATSRLVNLQTNRTSVDALQADPPVAVDQYVNTAKTLYEVDTRSSERRGGARPRSQSMHRVWSPPASSRSTR
ncbi:MAG: nitrate- and nitrite sensing domain-containing protein [Actinobacteria bacterium]|nr:nitrate- and nitrite sensing domain-containing protein [Actinomycetota bacterium]